MKNILINSGLILLSILLVSITILTILVVVFFIGYIIGYIIQIFTGPIMLLNLSLPQIMGILLVLINLIKK